MVLERLRLTPNSYVLHVGTLEPRKNIARLVEAFERAADGRPDLRLVLAGAPGWRFGPIERRIAASPLADRIMVAGYLDEPDLAALVESAAVVAYVSLYEGFGMPVLDALALGAAVVTSNTAAMPEAAGGGAILVDPRDVGDIARGLGEALETRVDLRARAQSRTYRPWRDVAGEHLDVYRSVVA